MGNVISFFGDRLQNFVANLGTSRDKAIASTYGTNVIDDAELINAYRTAWLPKKIVDIPALDATRKWRDWQAEGDQIELIEAEEIRLGLRQKVKEAKVKARLLGGAAILIGDGSQDLSEPLSPERMGKGGVKYLTVISRQHLSARELETDPSSPYYDKPKSYELTGQSGTATIHPSRLVIFIGEELPDYGLTAHDGWGDSSLLPVMDAIKHMDGTASNIASLVYEAKIDVIKMPGFMQGMADDNYGAQVLKRFQLAMTAKGINGALILDKDEEYTQKSPSFNTLPEIMDRFMQVVSGAGDIPATRLLGQSPAGMNATGESDLRNYYDRVAAMQTLEMQPAMYILDECLIRSALGVRPAEVHYIWSSLWQVSDKERAEIGKVTADTIKTLNDTQLFPEDALGKSAVNMLVERSIVPGLESEVDEYFEAHSEEPELSEDD